MKSLTVIKPLKPSIGSVPSRNTRKSARAQAQGCAFKGKPSRLWAHQLWPTSASTGCSTHIGDRNQTMHETSRMRVSTPMRTLAVTVHPAGQRSIPCSLVKFPPDDRARHIIAPLRAMISVPANSTRTHTILSTNFSFSFPRGGTARSNPRVRIHYPIDFVIYHSGSRGFHRQSDNSCRSVKNAHS
jgi:hypothetical protein